MAKAVLESTGLSLTADSRVDVEAGVITDVKVLGGASRNGRTYPPALLAERHGVYEAAQVYANHDYQQLKHGKARPLQDWGGVLRGVTFRGGAVYGDLHCLKETPAGKIILEAAARCPDKFGLSPMHLIDSRKERDGSETVTAILECWSVDAVTRPATTKTLFEQEEPMADDFAADPGVMAPPPPPSVEDAFMTLQNAVMASTDYDDQERLGILKDVMRLKEKVLGGGEEAEAPAEGEAAEESERRPVGRTARQIEQLAQGLRSLTIRQMAGEALQDYLDGPTMQLLLGMPDDGAVAAHLERMRRTTRRRYSPGPARSATRSVASESEGRRPGAVPRLTAGASRDEVRKFYRS